MEKVLSGKPISILLNKAIVKIVNELNLKPKMLLIQIGSDPASSYYVNSIINAGAKLGCNIELFSMPKDTTQQALLTVLHNANKDRDVHGIMIQKPLPKEIDENAVNLAINPEKDLDALHPVNLGKILLETDGFIPCTPAAVYYTMKYYGIDPQGKHLVILGRSNVVGKPLANMMLWKRTFANATVTICHSRSQDLSTFTRQADILVAAIGKALFVTSDMIKPNSILIDVGINEAKKEDGSSEYVGDINYVDCYDKVLAITPVPGGIGRITTSLLMLNLVKASLNAVGSNKNIDEYIDLIFSENKKEL